MRPAVQKTLVAGLLVAVAAGAVVAFLHFLPDLGGTERAPDFTIETVRHGTFTLAEHRGSIVVLDLMAVDCPSCRITEQAMLALAEGRPDVVIVSVDIWTALEDERYLDAHMQEIGADWPYGMDTDDVLLKYDAYEISKVVVIDPEGYIVWSRQGGVEEGPVLRAVADAEAGVLERQQTRQLGLAGFALFAGVASFFAPCAFPLLPGYMAYSLSLGGRTEGRRSLWREALPPGLSAAAGIFVVYAAMGLLVAALGGIASRFVLYLQPLMGLLAIALGVALLLGASLERFVAPFQHAVDRARRSLTGSKKEGTLAGFFGYGMGYGAAAAGCVAPVFLQLTLTAIALGAATGLRIFALYAGVSALLMVVATVVAVRARAWLQARAVQVVRVVNRASGAVLVLAGIYLVWFFSRGTALPF